MIFPRKTMDANIVHTEPGDRLLMCPRGVYSIVFYFIEHIRGLEELIDYYDQEARDHHQRRDTKKADICLTKKKLVMKEVNLIGCYFFI